MSTLFRMGLAVAAVGTALALVATPAVASPSNGPTGPAPAPTSTATTKAGTPTKVVTLREAKQHLDAEIARRHKAGLTAVANAIEYCDDSEPWNLVSDASGLFISREGDYPTGQRNMLRARGGDMSGPWEKFTICSGTFYGRRWDLIRGSNGLYVAAEFGYGGKYTGMLRARTSDNAIGPWELFDVQTDIDNYQSRIATYSGNLYVAVEMGYGGSDHAMLRARTPANQLGSWEIFY